MFSEALAMLDHNTELYMISELQNEVKEMEYVIAEKINTITELDNSIAEKDAIIADLQNNLNKLST